jgi:hypothetical protein
MVLACGRAAPWFARLGPPERPTTERDTLLLRPPDAEPARPRRRLPRRRREGR